MLLDLKIDPQPGGTINITTELGNPLATLAWLCQGEGRWWVDTMNGEPKLGPYEDDCVAIIAAFDYVMASRHHITKSDGSIIARETWRPDPKGEPAPEEPGEHLEGPALLLRLADEARTSQVAYLADRVRDLAAEWEAERASGRGRVRPANRKEQAAHG